VNSGISISLYDEHVAESRPLYQNYVPGAIFMHFNWPRWEMPVNYFPTDYTDYTDFVGRNCLFRTPSNQESGNLYQEKNNLEPKTLVLFYLCNPCNLWALSLLLFYLCNPCNLWAPSLLLFNPCNPCNLWAALLFKSARA